jgi:hypothetical protein
MNGWKLIELPPLDPIESLFPIVIIYASSLDVGSCENVLLDHASAHCNMTGFIN